MIELFIHQNIVLIMMFFFSYCFIFSVSILLYWFMPTPVEKTHWTNSLIYLKKDVEDIKKLLKEKK